MNMKRNGTIGFLFLYKAVYYLLYTKLPVVILIYQITKYFQV